MKLYQCAVTPKREQFDWKLMCTVVISADVLLCGIEEQGLPKYIGIEYIYIFGLVEVYSCRAASMRPLWGTRPFIN